MLDKVLLVLLKHLPVHRVLAQIDLINLLGAGHLVLEHLLVDVVQTGVGADVGADDGWNDKGDSLNQNHCNES